MNVKLWYGWHNFRIWQTETAFDDIETDTDTFQQTSLSSLGLGLAL